MSIKPYSQCYGHKVRTSAEMCRDLRMTVVGAEDAWPLGPRVVTAARGRGLREQFKVHHGLGTVTHRSADAIVARVTATYDDDVLATGVDVIAVSQFGIEQRLGVQLRRVARNFRIALNILLNEMPYT